MVSFNRPAFMVHAIVPILIVAHLPFIPAYTAQPDTEQPGTGKTVRKITPKWVLEGEFDILAYEAPYLYIHDHGKLIIRQIIEGEESQIVGTLELSGPCESFVLRDDLAYCVNGKNGIEVIDITSKSQPKSIFSYPTFFLSKKLFISQNLGYILYKDHYFSGFTIVDVSEPAKPSFVSDFYIRREINDHLYGIDHREFPLMFKDNIVFYLSGRLIYIIDVKDPKAPELLSKIEAPASEKPKGWPSEPEFTDLAMKDNTLYLSYFDPDVNSRGERLGGLMVWDISNSENPKLVNNISLQLGSMPYQIIITNDHLILADAGELRTYGIEDRSNPQFKCLLEFPDVAHSSRSNRMVVEDGTAFIPSYTNGVQIIKISNPEKLKRIGYYPPRKWKSHSTEVWVSGKTFIVKEDVRPDYWISYCTLD